MKKSLFGFITLIIGATMLGGCTMFTHALIGGENANQPEQLVNTQEIAASEFESITVDYTFENVTFLESTTDKIVLKEYMNVDNRDYYASMLQVEDRLAIKAGKRPSNSGMRNFRAHIEVYLPKAYNGALSVQTSSGRVVAQQNLKLSALKAESSSGNITFSNVFANTVDLKASSGSIAIGASADTNIETSSGDIDVSYIFGNGTFVASSGKMRIVCSDGAGKISAKASSGSIEVTVPQNLSFDFALATSSGKTTTDYFRGKIEYGKSVKGTVGSEPTASINLKTSSGNITLK